MKQSNNNRWLLLGALNAALAIVLGAFAAHGLRSMLNATSMHVFHTASEYHFYHALGLGIVGLMPGDRSPRLRDWAGGLMLAGIVLFCGSLYILSVTGIRWFGIVTPFGGIAFIVAWLLVVLAAWRGRR